MHIIIHKPEAYAHECVFLHLSSGTMRLQYFPADLDTARTEEENAATRIPEKIYTLTLSTHS